MNEHFFRNGGPCVWCGALPVKVADRRAPPWCDERPEELCEDGRGTANDHTGY